MAKQTKITTKTTAPLVEMVFPAELPIENLIHTIRGQQVMLDRDLAMLYQVETKALNQAVKRNIERFPERFRFQLSEEEMKLVTICDRLRTLKHSSSCSFVFTEQGISMLATVLHSKTAIEVSIRIMDTFVAMRRFLYSHRETLERVEKLEYRQCLIEEHLDDYDSRFNDLYSLFDNNPNVSSTKYILE